MIYRNRKLLDFASTCPHCMCCKSPNMGQVVACHVNSSEFKGMGMKGPDTPAYMCNECHDLQESRKGKLSKFERDLMFYKAAFRTWVWLMETAKLEVK